MVHDSTRKRGAEAEEFALQYLVHNQLVLVKQNFYCKNGEVDLVMLDEQDLVFIEVRSRKNQTFMHAVESIDLNKQKRIIKTSQYFLLKNKQFQQYNIRYDVVIILNPCSFHNINWIKNAFQT